eukprot:Nk52_evm13s2192 gene=Nk52_evmTU13s2192
MSGVRFIVWFVAILAMFICASSAEEYCGLDEMDSVLEESWTTPHSYADADRTSMLADLSFTCKDSSKKVQHPLRLAGKLINPHSSVAASGIVGYSEVSGEHKYLVSFSAKDHEMDLGKYQLFLYDHESMDFEDPHMLFKHPLKENNKQTPYLVKPNAVVTLLSVAAFLYVASVKKNV